MGNPAVRSEVQGSGNHGTRKRGKKEKKEDIGKGTMNPDLKKLFSFAQALFLLKMDKGEKSNRYGAKRNVQG